MPPTPPELLASNHPILSLLFWLAAGTYALAFSLTAGRPRLGRWALGAAVVLHVAGTVGRGLAIEFLPLTNKLESFSAMALALGIVTLFAWVPSRTYLLPLLALTAGTLGVALTFPLNLAWPPPLMRTIWYPLHVPLSFASYALWTAAAAAGLAWFRHRELAWLQLVDRLALWGFLVWSVSMVAGGVWGVVAWGAYFMWDPKIIWSVILWFFYASFVHVRLTPSMHARPWARPALAIAGFGCVFVAYVGTSFFFGRSSHAFS